MSNALLTLEETARQYPYWRPRTLRAFVKDGALPCYRLGRRLYLKTTDLETFIESHYCPAPKKGRALQVVPA